MLFVDRLDRLTSHLIVLRRVSNGVSRHLLTIVYAGAPKTNIDSICVLLVTLRMFKYFSINPAFGVIWRTLGEAAETLVTYIMLMVITLFGFVFMAYVSFGGHEKEYLTVSGSLNTVTSMLLGKYMWTHYRIL